MRTNKDRTSYSSQLHWQVCPWRRAPKFSTASAFMQIVFEYLIIRLKIAARQKNRFSSRLMLCRWRCVDAGETITCTNPIPQDFSGSGAYYPCGKQFSTSASTPLSPSPSFSTSPPPTLPPPPSFPLQKTSPPPPPPVQSPYPPPPPKYSPPPPSTQGTVRGQIRSVTSDQFRNKCGKVMVACDYFTMFVRVYVWHRRCVWFDADSGP